VVGATQTLPMQVFGAPQHWPPQQLSPAAQQGVSGSVGQ
jgi:hypothetical protein